MIYELELPVGAQVKIGENTLTHRGAGTFTSPTPPWLIEGVLEEGTPEVLAWPNRIHIREIEGEPSVRNVRLAATGWLTDESGSPFRSRLEDHG